MLQTGDKYGVSLKHSMHCAAGTASPNNSELVANHFMMLLALRSPLRALENAAGRGLPKDVWTLT